MKEGGKMKAGRLFNNEKLPYDFCFQPKVTTRCVLMTAWKLVLA